MVCCCNIFIHFNFLQCLNASESHAAREHSMSDNITRKCFKSIIQYSLLIIFDLYLHRCQNTFESARVQFCSACIWSIVSSQLWTPLATPKSCPPRAIVIQRLLFFPVFVWCAQSGLVTVQRDLGERDHTEPQIVLIQLPTPRLDNSPWREGPQKWIRPLALTFFPVHLPPDWRGCSPLQLSSEASPGPAGHILLARILQMDVDYLAAAQAPFWSDVTPEGLPGTNPDMWKSDHVSHEKEHLRSWRI